MKTEKANKGSGLLYFINFIILKIVMAFVYFFIFIPFGFLIRITGKDLLKLKFSSKVKTYWIKRIKDLDSMNRQF
tara:strand:- start:191 stop:415 length:225 start_codon:yes stop_codon:yes gene_type:complete